MGDSTTISDALPTKAGQPRRMRTDMGEAEQHPLKDQIAADRYVNEKGATGSTSPRLLVNKLVPPGSV